MRDAELYHRAGALSRVNFRAPPRVNLVQTLRLCYNQDAAHFQSLETPAP